MFRNREDAAMQVARRLQGRVFRAPLVLAIPRGGVVVGAVLARELGADLDVVLARKLRAPGQPELALGAISEDGEIYLSNLASKSNSHGHTTRFGSASSQPGTASASSQSPNIGLLHLAAQWAILLCASW